MYKRQGKERRQITIVPVQVMQVHHIRFDTLQFRNKALCCLLRIEPIVSENAGAQRLHLCVGIVHILDAERIFTFSGRIQNIIPVSYTHLLRVSAVSLWKQVADRLEVQETSWETALTRNRSAVVSAQLNPKRDAFFSALAEAGDEMCIRDRL